MCDTGSERSVNIFIENRRVCRELNLFRTVTIHNASGTFINTFQIKQVAKELIETTHFNLVRDRFDKTGITKGVLTFKLLGR